MEATLQGASKVILVVDDDPGCSGQLAELLRCQGYEAVAVTSGADALRFVEEHGPPGLVLLDLIMPEMGGVEVLAKLRDTHPDIPVCLVTALYDEQVLQTAFQLGVYECVSKPMDLEYLKTAVLVKMFEARRR